MRYRLLLIFLALFLLAPGFWLQADWILNYPVSRVNYERLRVGMTLRQAEEIMGKPATHWPPPRILYDEIDSDGRPVLAINDSPADPFRFWTNEEQFRPYGVQRADTISDTHMIAIFLDPGGRVLGKSYMCAPDMSVARTALRHAPFLEHVFDGSPWTVAHRLSRLEVADEAPRPFWGLYSVRNHSGVFCVKTMIVEPKSEFRVITTNSVYFPNY